MAFAKRYAAGFIDADNTKPCDATALNAIEAALLKLYGVDPTTSQVGIWDGTKFAPGLIADANVSATAAISKSKLNLAGQIVDADVSAAAAIAVSKISHPGGTSTFLRADGTWASPTTTIGMGTTLPSTPSNLDEYVYLADGPNGIAWHLKFYSTINKWVFIGGSWLFQEITNLDTTASTAYVPLGTAGPTLTVPLTGNYDIDIGFRHASQVTSQGIASMSYDIGATTASDNDRIQELEGTASVWGPPMMRPRRKAFSAGTVLTSKYKTSGGTAGFENRWMRLRPVTIG